MHTRWRTCIAFLALSFIFSNSIAAVLLEDAQLVSRSETFAQVAPPPKTFTVTNAGRYNVTLKDVGFPTTLTSAQLIIMSGVRTVTRLTKPGSIDFDATPGAYTAYMFGSGAGAGTLSVSIASSGASLLAYEAGIAGNPTAPDPNRTSIATSISVTQAGTYTVALTDRAFPAALVSVDLLVVAKNGTPVARTCVPAQPSICSESASFGASVADYDVFVTATAQTAVQGGLFSVRIDTGSASVPALASTYPVGALKSHAVLDFPSAGQYALQANDFEFPSALASLQTLIAQGGDVIVTSAGTVTQSFSAAKGSATLYTVASTASNSGMGAYGVQILQDTQTFFSDARAVTGSTLVPSASGEGAYVFTTDISTPGQYRVQSHDFAFPAAIASMQMMVAQGGALLGTLGTSGSITIQAKAGPLLIIVITGITSSTTGLFDVRVDAQSSGQTILQATQGIGDLFHSRSITITKSGSLDVTLADAAFPAALADLALSVTQGNVLVGQIFGGGTFSFAATPGDYSLNFVARAPTGQNYGLYGTKIEDTPLPPVVTLAANPVTVASGGTTTVEWSSTGATSCIASGAWSGTRVTSGTEQSVGPFTSNSTLTLTCTGLGGSTSAAANITIAAEKSKGGGPIEAELMLLLMLILMQREMTSKRIRRI